MTSPGAQLTRERVVTAVSYLGTYKGKNSPRAFACDDGETYVVKFKNQRRAVINEFVGYAVARFLGVPVPPNRPVLVPRGVIEASGDLNRLGLTTAVHHGSMLLKGCVDFRSIRARELALENADALPGLVVFGNLVLNHDGNNADNNLLQISPSGGVQYRAVDFDEILAGPRWTIDTMRLTAPSTELVPVFPIIRSSVTGASSLSPWLELSESLSKEFLVGMLQDVPASWDIGEAEGSAICDFLLTRKDLVRGILMANRDRFPNWRSD